MLPMPNNTTTKYWRCAAYVRLSQEDGDKTESNSIVNQKQLIQNYISNHTGLTLVRVYADDGYSGVDFNRPQFTQMIDDIKHGQIDCVIVKDLSRFGRNYSEVGRYLEHVFPLLNIRFIAINDDVDTSRPQTSAEMFVLPFKNLFNDAYCRDTSIKVRSQLAIKRKNGCFVGRFAPYGYAKDPDNHNHLIIDPQAADIVRQIFEWKISGLSPIQIADKLNSQGILCPLEYKKSQGLKVSTNLQTHAKAMWSPGAILRILKNEMYTGTMIQGKTTSPSYKVKTTVAKPEAEWDRVEGTHEPIVSKSMFDSVQSMLLQDTRVSPNQESLYLFSGFLRCGDCNQNMIRRQRKYKDRTYGYYTCSGYHNKSGCTSHTISEEKLYQAVLDAIKVQFAMVLNLDRLVQEAAELPEAPDAAHRFEAELAKLDEDILKNQAYKLLLLEHLQAQLLTTDEYHELSTLYDERIRSSRIARKNLEAARDSIASMPFDNDWLAIFRQHPEINELDRILLAELIDVIEIHDDKSITIHFKFEDQIKRALAYLELKLPGIQAEMAS